MKMIPILLVALSFGAESAWGQGGYLFEDRIGEILEEMREGGRKTRDAVNDLITSFEKSCKMQFQRPSARWTHSSLSGNPNDGSAVNMTVGRCAIAFRATCAIAKTGPPPQSVFRMNIDDNRERRLEIETLKSPTKNDQAEWWGLLKRVECVLYGYEATKGITGIKMDRCQYCEAAYSN